MDIEKILKKYSYFEDLKCESPEELVELIITYYENIIGCMPGNVYWMDQHCAIIGANKNTLDMFGFSGSKQLKEFNFEKMKERGGWSQETMDHFKRDTLEVLRTGKAKTNIEEPPIYHYDGKKIYFLTSRVPLFNKNKDVIGVVGISIDITERKRMEKELRQAKEMAEAASEAKTEFIANMSHDIRTPISGVIGIARILEKEGDSEKDREYGHVIHTSSEGLLFLLNDILEVISADESRKSDLKFETFSLSSRLVHLQELMSSNFKTEQIKFNFYIDPILPEYVFGDRIKIDRILLNLVSNALKFTKEGHIDVKMNAVSQDKEQVVVQVEVADTGIGISKDQLSKIFERFYRVSPSFDNRYSGHGIGLYIVQKYISLLGGKILVKSELGKGTSFIITLPLVLSAKELIQEKLKKVSLQNDSSQIQSNDATSVVLSFKEKQTDQFKVLLVEDDSVARHVTKKFLENVGFITDVVGDAETGFNLLLTKTYDLVVTDIGLPGMNGNQFASLIRHWENLMQRLPLPIIGLSAHGADQHNESMKAGLNELLIKPINEVKVAAIYDRYFSKKIKDLVQEINNKKSDEKKQNEHWGEDDLPESEKELLELDHYPLFDLNGALKMVGGRKDILIELLTTLVQETIPEELSKMKEAHKVLNWDIIRKSAHKLKGSAMYCGVTRMRYACQFLEKYYRFGNKKRLEKLYSQLINVLHETKQNINRILVSG